jgi:hypothetical protein
MSLKVVPELINGNFGWMSQQAARILLFPEHAQNWCGVEHAAQDPGKSFADWRRASALFTLRRCVTATHATIQPRPAPIACCIVYAIRVLVCAGQPNLRATRRIRLRHPFQQFLVVFRARIAITGVSLAFAQWLTACLLAQRARMRAARRKSNSPGLWAGRLIPQPFCACCSVERPRFVLHEEATRRRFARSS